jgi:hypothetical protein
MIIDLDSSATDREARNEYLIDLDEAWEVCREDVEEARSSYETGLESTFAAHDRKQENASASHHQALDRAWTAYKQQVAGTLTITDRAEARASYNGAAADIRHTYEETMTRDRASYVDAVHDACLAYEAALDQSFAKHREAIQKVRKFLKPTEEEGGRDVEQSEPMRMIEALIMEIQPDETTREDPSSADEPENARAESVLSQVNGSAA